MSKDKELADDDIVEEIPSEEADKERDTAAYRINSYGADFTVEVLFNKMESGEIVVPPFQRQFVWPPAKSSKLIESFLLGLPVPQIFLYKEEEKQDLLVVDGQQRLRTIEYFFKKTFENGKPFFLKGVKGIWEGKNHDSLTEPDKRRLNNNVLRAVIFQQTDPKDNSSIFEIFKRLNTGGMSLTQQEIRNCVIRGRINEFLAGLNNYNNWRNLFGKSSPDSRMRDIEMMLRFFALYEDLEEYRKPMKDFVDNYMNSKKNLSKEEEDKFARLFKGVMDLVSTQIGERAFKLKAGINIAVFDSIAVALARIGVEKVKDVKDKYKALIGKEAYLAAVTGATTDEENVKSRIKIAIQEFSK